MSYKKLSELVHLVDIKNTDCKVTRVIGVSITKNFIPSVANLNGVDLTKYNLIKKNQFACKLMSVGRDLQLPIDLYKEDDLALISSAYYVFEVKDENEILPDYLNMWFRRKETDRWVGYISGGDVRGGISWDMFLEMEVNVPSIEKQREIVAQYQAVANKIKVNEQICEKLDLVCKNLYKDIISNNNIIILNDLCELITDGKHGDCEDSVNSGFYFLSAKDIRNDTLIYKDARQITENDFLQTHKRTNLKPGDICIVSTGATIGRVSIAPDSEITFKTTFQKSVALLKPSNKIYSLYLFYFIKSNEQLLREMASGTSQTNLLLGDLRNMEINSIDFQTLTNFNSKVEPLFLRKQFFVNQNQKLTQLQSLLLSRLATLEG
ncbi:putative EcoKI restriction-modification system protein HsdS [Sphingobacterium sp. PM2-P1-29]|nr:putative EcoKI restriction-modification system protein HsdS [Sphingobacterium sp. PM2-P1-29]